MSCAPWNHRWKFVRTREDIDIYICERCKLFDFRTATQEGDEAETPSRDLTKEIIDREPDF